MAVTIPEDHNYTSELDRAAFDFGLNENGFLKEEILQDQWRKQTEIL